MLTVIYRLCWFQKYKLSHTLEEKWRLMCWTLASKAEQWGGEIDSKVIQECGFVLVRRRESLLCSDSWARSSPRKKKIKIPVISVICIIERNSFRKFSLPWEMTWVCWNYSQRNTNKHAQIKENALESRRCAVSDVISTDCLIEPQRSVLRYRIIHLLK